MGTNHYLAAPQFTDDYDESGRGLHIGKLSAGWTFSWRAHPELGIRSRDDWERTFKVAGDAIIVNEYGAFLTFREFADMAFIENRDPERVLSKNTNGSAQNWIDDRGESFSNYEFC